MAVPVPVPLASPVGVAEHDGQPPVTVGLGVENEAGPEPGDGQLWFTGQAVGGESLALRHGQLDVGLGGRTAKAGCYPINLVAGRPIHQPCTCLSSRLGGSHGLTMDLARPSMMAPFVGGSGRGTTT
jgi:hypothetical protein